MQLECTLESFDFVPLVKMNGLVWQPKKTLHKGSVFEAEDAIGHQLLAQYPSAFKVLSYGEAPVRRKSKQITAENLEVKQDESVQL